MKDLLEVLRTGDPDLELAKAIDPDRLPAHIAIIMDGNGRWASRRSLPRVAGHRAGVGPVRSTVETCARLGIQVLTLYAFSMENWKRPRAEIETLWRLLRFYLRKELPELQKNDIRLVAIGRLDALPDQVRGELDSAVEATSGNQGLRVNLAINYSGRSEIADAARAIATEVQAGRLRIDDIDETTVSDALYTAGMADPDLLIRTAGEMRVSNYLLWQISYAELWVTPKCWPEFDEATLHEALRDYAKRERRFGALMEDDIGQ